MTQLTVFIIIGRFATRVNAEGCLRKRREYDFRPLALVLDPDAPELKWLVAVKEVKS